MNTKEFSTISFYLHCRISVKGAMHSDGMPFMQWILQAHRQFRQDITLVEFYQQIVNASLGSIGIR